MGCFHASLVLWLVPVDGITHYLVLSLSRHATGIENAKRVIAEPNTTNSQRWFIVVKIFISHSRLDGWLVKPISGALKEIGVEPYVAEIETPEAKPLPTKFGEHIRTSDVTILLLTANVMHYPRTRDVINWEAATAHSLGKPIYVFREKEVEVPLMISYITDYFTFDPIKKEDLSAIMKRIRKIARILKEHEDAVKAIVTVVAVGLGILLFAYLLSKAR